MDSPLDNHLQLSTSTANINTIKVKPKQELYSTFSQEEIIEINSSLDLEREIPFKYCYKRKQANIWNEFILKGE